MSINIYPAKLDQYLKDNKRSRYIPKRLPKDSKLFKYHKYWHSMYCNCFKVQDIYSIEDNEYYSVRYNDSLFAELPYPVNDLYELIPDRRNIYSIRNLVDSKKSYTGAEIRYWFWTRNIDLENSKYKGFASFLDINSKSTISDNKFYFIAAKLVDEKYIKCRLIVDESKLN